MNINNPCLKIETTNYPLKFINNLPEHDKTFIDIYKVFAFKEHIDYAAEHNYPIVITDTCSSSISEMINYAYIKGFTQIYPIEIPVPSPSGGFLDPKIYFVCCRQKLTPSNLNKITFVSRMANSDGEPIEGTEHEHTLLYNKTWFSENELDAIIDSGEYEFDPRLIEISEKQIAFLADKQLID